MTDIWQHYSDRHRQDRPAVADAAPKVGGEGWPQSQLKSSGLRWGGGTPPELGARLQLQVPTLVSNAKSTVFSPCLFPWVFCIALLLLGQRPHVHAIRLILSTIQVCLLRLHTCIYLSILAVNGPNYYPKRWSSCNAGSFQYARARILAIAILRRPGIPIISSAYLAFSALSAASCLTLVFPSLLFWRSTAVLL